MLSTGTQDGARTSASSDRQQRFQLATTALLLVAFVASYVPARRASRIDPLAALRHG